MRSTADERRRRPLTIAEATPARAEYVAFRGSAQPVAMTMALTGKVAPKLGWPSGLGLSRAVSLELHGITTQSSAIAAIERLFKADIEAKQVAAIIFEPIQGEGGFNVAPPELVAAIRRICDEHGIV